MPVFNSPHYNYFVDLVVVADVYSNAIAVFLSYSRYNKIYIKICGCCDDKCAKRCMRRDERTLSRVVSTTESSKTVTTGSCTATSPIGSPSSIVIQSQKNTE